MKIAVTGGAGFIGSNFIKYLNKKGIKNIDIYEDLDNIYNKLNNINGLSFNNLLDFRGLIDKNIVSNYTHIFHLGAISSTSNDICDFDKIKYKNIDFSNILFSRIKNSYLYNNGHCAKLIFASSASVYGNTNDFTERVDDLKPLHWYGMSKLLSDRKMIDQNIGISLRFFNVYGPGEKHKLEQGMTSPVTNFLNSCLRKRGYHKVCIYTDSQNMARDFIYIDDVCEILYMTIYNPIPNGIYNVGSGEATEWDKIADLVCGVLNIDKEKYFEYRPLHDELKPTYQYYTKADLDKLKNVFGYHCNFTTFFSGISRTFELDFP